MIDFPYRRRRHPEAPLSEKILMPPELQKQCAEERVLAQIIGASDAAPESGRNVRGKTE